MYEEIEQKRSSKQSSKDKKWLKTDLATLFNTENIKSLYSELVEHNEVALVKNEDGDRISAFPDFGATTLKGKGVEKLHQRVLHEWRRSLQPLGRSELTELFIKQEAIWRRVVMATEAFYTPDMVKRSLAKLTEEDIKELEKKSDEEVKKVELKSIDMTLAEVGVKTGISLVFSLLKQIWVQSSWQRQLHEALIDSKSIGNHDLATPT